MWVTNNFKAWYIHVWCCLVAFYSVINAICFITCLAEEDQKDRGVQEKSKQDSKVLLKLKWLWINTYRPKLEIGTKFRSCQLLTQFWSLWDNWHGSDCLPSWNGIRHSRLTSCVWLLVFIHRLVIIQLQVYYSIRHI